MRLECFGKAADNLRLGLAEWPRPWRLLGRLVVSLFHPPVNAPVPVDINAVAVLALAEVASALDTCAPTHILQGHDLHVRLQLGQRGRIPNTTLIMEARQSTHVHCGVRQASPR